MGAGSPIVSEKWVEACAKLGAWVDAREHLLSDPVAEKAFGFSLAAALDRAQQALLLAGMRVFLTPGAAARPLGPLLCMRSYKHNGSSGVGGLYLEQAPGISWSL